MNTTAHVEPHKKGPRTWSWHPVRVAGHSMIAVFAGDRLVRVFGAHEVDDAHALCGLRNEGRVA